MLQIVDDKNMSRRGKSKALDLVKLIGGHNNEIIGQLCAELLINHTLKQLRQNGTYSFVVVSCCDGSKKVDPKCKEGVRQGRSSGHI